MKKLKMMGAVGALSLLAGCGNGGVFGSVSSNCRMDLGFMSTEIRIHAPAENADIDAISMNAKADINLLMDTLGLSSWTSLFGEITTNDFIDYIKEQAAKEMNVDVSVLNMSVKDGIVELSADIPNIPEFLASQGVKDANSSGLVYKDALEQLQSTRILACS